MSRPRPPYLHRTVTRHGKVAYYVWRRPGRKIRIHGEYGSKAFMDAYRAALWGEDPKPDLPEGSLAALIEAYKSSPKWLSLSDATRRQRSNIFDRIMRTAGLAEVADIDRALIVQARDAMSGHGAAKHMVQTLRGLFQWAVEAGKIEDDPTAGVKTARPKTEGFHTWSDAEIAAYEARWPVGTRERLWLAVLLYTGLRRGDAALLGPRHVKNGVIEIRTGKTGVPVVLPVAPELAAILEASPVGIETFIATAHGRPLTKESFGNLFREACAAAGVPGAAHGLRKAAAVRLAEAGATVAQLNAVFGWSGARMALLYVEKAERALLARQAMERLKK